jgi:hypothetical protein
MNTDILMTAGLVVVIIMAVVAVYAQWQKATPAQRVELLEDTVRRLVDAADKSMQRRAVARPSLGGS